MSDDVVVLVNTPERLDLVLPHGRVTLSRNRDGTVLADVKPRAHRESRLLLPLEALARIGAWLDVPRVGEVMPEFKTADELREDHDDASRRQASP